MRIDASDEDVADGMDLLHSAYRQRNANGRVLRELNRRAWTHPMRMSPTA
ncbi:hypothetical protein KF728_21450 [Candidatus Obscuribacterales bacterium]|nr:hypothetical protein [Candidatus Obscuribacterales bacterium]